MSRLRDLGFLAEYVLVRVAAGLLRLLPLDTAVAVAAAVCEQVAPRTRLHRRALANIETALPDMASSERSLILSRMWQNTGRVIAETLLLDRVVGDPGRIEIVGAEDLERHLRAPGPNIGLTLHLGNWELVGWACAVCGGKLSGVYRPLGNPYLDRFLQRKRQLLYPGGLLFKGTMGGKEPVGKTTRAVIDHLRKGGHLGLVCDQVENSCNFTVPFFAVPAKFTPAPALVARRIGARVWIARGLRLNNSSRFRIEVTPFHVQQTDDPEADVKAMTAAMAAQFEAWIRETPDQWMWWQRRSIGQ